MPVPPGRRAGVLEDLLRLEYPKEKLEVIVGRGAWPPRQRNLAVQEAKGELLLFLDDDVTIPPGYLLEMLRWYSQADCIGWGGPSLPVHGNSNFQRAIAFTFQTWWGTGPQQARYRRCAPSQDANDSHLILCNLSIRRDVFLRVGGFSEWLYPNEENELIDRLRQAGYRLGYSPHLAVSRPVDVGSGEHFRRMFRYGKGRVNQMKIRFSARNLTLFLVVVGLSFLGLGCLMGSSWSRGIGLGYLLWLLGAGIHAGWLFRTMAMVVPAAWVILGTHLSYLFGFWVGFLSSQSSKRPFGLDEIVIERVKL